MEGQSLEQMVSNWKQLNEGLMKLSEEDCQFILSFERNGKNRLSYLFRIHARLNVLRYNRERCELASESLGVVSENKPSGNRF